MKIKAVTIKNFRRLVDLQLHLEGKSAFLIAENAGGKTSALVAVARGLGRDLSFSRPDFTDAKLPIEIVVTLNDLSFDDHATFGERNEFGDEITLFHFLGTDTGHEPEGAGGVRRHITGDDRELLRPLRLRPGTCPARPGGCRCQDGKREPCGNLRLSEGSRQKKAPRLPRLRKWSQGESNPRLRRERPPS